MTKIAYHLQANEAPILTAESIQRSGAGNGELVLTNLHLIWMKKGIFGKVKDIEYLPLSWVKVINGRAQALQTKSRQGGAQLEVFFQDRQEAFQFLPTEKREVVKWMREINRAITGNDLPPEETGGKFLPGAAAMAGSLLGTFRDRAGRGNPAGPPPPPAPVNVTTTCPGCGSSLTGVQGSVARCQFCDSETTLT